MPGFSIINATPSYAVNTETSAAKNVWIGKFFCASFKIIQLFKIDSCDINKISLVPK